VTTNDQRRHDTAYLNKRLFTDAEKTRMIGLPYGVKNYDNILGRFRLIIPERRGQTDRRTDRRQCADAR